MSFRDLRVCKYNYVRVQSFASKLPHLLALHLSQLHVALRAWQEKVQVAELVSEEGRVVWLCASGCPARAFHEGALISIKDILSGNGRGILDTIGNALQV